MELKREIIYINGVDLEIVIDEEGNKWYPVTRLFKKVLLKRDKTYRYVKQEIGEDMRYWPVVNSYNPKITHIWYMSEKALINLLKRIEVSPYSERTIERERALHGALKYFGIKRQERSNTFTVVEPTKKEYNDWELLCFKYDKDINANIIWRACNKCRRYFPYSKYYFEMKTYAQIGDTCLECKGEEFKNKNRDIQTLKDEGRMDLLPYILKDKPVELYKKIRNDRLPFELDYFHNQSRILQILAYLESERRVTGEGGFYLSNIASVLNIHLRKLKNIVDGKYEIGIEGPLPQHKYLYIPDNLTEEERRKREFLEQTSAERKAAKRKRDIEIYKKNLRNKTIQKRKENTAELLDYCRKNMECIGTKDLYEKILPGATLMFMTPKGLHILTYEQPIDKMKVYIHRIPVTPTKIKKMTESMKEVQKEYED